MTEDYFAGDQRTNRARMLAGDWYVADDPDSGRLHRRALSLADAYHRAHVAGEDGARDILVTCSAPSGMNRGSTHRSTSSLARTSTSAGARS